MTDDKALDSLVTRLGWRPAGDTDSHRAVDAITALRKERDEARSELGAALFRERRDGKLVGELGARAEAAEAQVAELERDLEHEREAHKATADDAQSEKQENAALAGQRDALREALVKIHNRPEGAHAIACEVLGRVPHSPATCTCGSKKAPRG